MGGFELRETLTGSLRLAANPGHERSLSLTFRGDSGPIRRFLRRPTLAIEGEIDAEGFADHRPIQGSIELATLRAGRLPYAFSFAANDGTILHFTGERTLRSAALMSSFTLLPGTIADAQGSPVGQALLRFDLRSELSNLLSSFRLTRS